MTGEIKICGLRDLANLEAALSGGADLVGFVRFAKSPRHVSLEEAGPLSEASRGRALRAVLLVDADDVEIDAVIAAFDPDLLQLHGDESPERVATIRARAGRPVMKAIGIAEPADLATIDRYAGAADRLLLDAKPPRGAALPGGNGRPFDWSLLEGLGARTPFTLSGGLSPTNVAEAIATTGATGVDVSSGVESSPGFKNPALIEAFIRAARAGFANRARAAAPRRDKVA